MLTMGRGHFSRVAPTSPSPEFPLCSGIREPLNDADAPARETKMFRKQKAADRPSARYAQVLLEQLSNVHDVSVTTASKSGGNSTVDSYTNATLWTIAFDDPVGDIPGLEV